MAYNISIKHKVARDLLKLPENVKRLYESDSVPIEETDFWKEMQSNRIGNLLAGSRLKAGLTQAMLAKKLGIRQNMISDYERGRRRLSISMAKKIAELLQVNADRLL